MFTSTQSRFSDILHGKRGLDRISVVFLRRLVSKYSYSQPVRMIYAKALMDGDKELFEVEVNRAAAIAPERRKFRAYISGKEVAGISAGMRVGSGSAERKGPDRDAGTGKKRKLAQQEIIDRFLEVQPRIEGKKEGLPEGDLSPESLSYDPSLASETLAEVFLKQGKTARAISIYQKLSLMFPEKSSYFAKKIESIQKENN
ncbi:MAG: hypothetical protein EA394_05205 [Bacteroidia bacterium]|nr:MAG: hypothetical protein EA394_05205 [Bacteroidia bacterium]